MIVTDSILREKVFEEINLLPENRLTDIYQFIHYFRLGVESSNKPTIEQTPPILSLAGAWNDFPEEEYRLTDCWSRDC